MEGVTSLLERLEAPGLTMLYFEKLSWKLSGIVEKLNTLVVIGLSLMLEIAN